MIFRLPSVSAGAIAVCVTKRSIFCACVCTVCDAFSPVCCSVIEGLRSARRRLRKLRRRQAHKGCVRSECVFISSAFLSGIFSVALKWACLVVHAVTCVPLVLTSTALGALGVIILLEFLRGQCNSQYVIEHDGLGKCVYVFAGLSAVVYIVKYFVPYESIVGFFSLVQVFSQCRCHEKETF